jgi:uncharacterized protein
MHYVHRSLFPFIKNQLKSNPVVALLGPRQCGKSTLARELLKNIPNTVFLDLEKASDLNKLNDVWSFFNANKGHLICLDEIQLKPELFRQMRSYVDEVGENQQFLVLGSASRDLIKQSSETLAGRISYIEITPFMLPEVKQIMSVDKLWLYGGFPRSCLKASIEESSIWRENYIKTFLERDLPQLGFRVPSMVLNNFWKMCAHIQGQLLNSTKLGTSLGVSSNTIKNYLHILEETFMIRLLQPYHENLKKRLVKSPKIYIRDTGIVHTLLGIENFNDLLGHPVYGFSFESLVIENLIRLYPRHTPYFYRTAKGHELDLILLKGKEKLAFEIKASTTPKVEDGFWKAIEDVQPTKTVVIARVDEPYPLHKDIMAYNILDYIDSVRPDT